MKTTQPASRPLCIVGALLLTAVPVRGAGDPVSERARNLVESTGLRGGLAVHVGCGGGRLCVDLAKAGNFLVHGLAATEPDARAAAAAAREAGLAERITVGRLRGKSLPHVDRLVRLIVCESKSGIPRDEVLRVLAPLGAACFVDGDRVEVVRKPWPKRLGEWSHFLHGANNNAVVDDPAIGPPAHVQWIANPAWGRHHETLASVSSVVSARGRLFAIVDEGPTGVMHLPSRWRLIARDAFSGVRLWSRPINLWEHPLRSFRSGPPQLPRRLVAVGDRVYATLGYGKPVEVLDAETGKTLATYADTAGAEEILVADDALIVVTRKLTFSTENPVVGLRGDRDAPRRIVAVGTTDGETLWRRDDDAAAAVLPLSLTLSAGRVFFAAPESVHAVDAKTGTEVWKQAHATPLNRPTYWSPTVLEHRGVLLVGGDGVLAAFACDDGKPLWNCRMSQGFNSSGDVFGIGDTVWLWVVPELTDAQVKQVEKTIRKPIKWGWGYVSDHYGRYECRDLKTGKLKTQFTAKGSWTFGHHHRCFRNKATTRFLITGKRGIEFHDVTRKQRSSRHRWVRGMCQYGILPANGMIVVPPHPCRCYQVEKINGFCALVSHRSRVKPSKPFEPGLAFAEAVELAKQAPVLAPADAKREGVRLGTDWPMYRHDPARSGSSTTPVPHRLAVAWRSTPGGRITPPVIAAGRVYVAETDAATVHALDARTGERLWSYSASGAIDSPPTVHGGLVLFGSADGWLTCLRAKDGVRAWRRQVAPEERLIVARGRLESAWPVHGSVLVRRTKADEPGLAFVAAGRSQHLDGGIRLGAINVATGAFVASHGKQWRRRTPPLGDLLVSDDRGLFLRGQQALAFPGAGGSRRGSVLAADAGLLDTSLFDRVIWKYRSVHGQMLVFTPRRIVGVRSGYHIGKEFLRTKTSVGALLLPNFGKYQKHGLPRGNLLFSAQPYGRSKSGPASPPWLFRSAPGDRVRRYDWKLDVPLQIRGLALARRAGEPKGELLLIVGWSDAAEAKTDTGCELWTLDAAKGKKLAALKLNRRPVFDGLAVADGSAFVALDDGSVVRLRAAKDGE
jgi:outer membrane protein assembly factor BamB